MNRSTASPAKAGSESLLAEYRRKRDFTKTAEPPAKTAKARAQSLFVIQEHHARRLHYDFRLEADGVLKSWAVTKIPTMEPGIRRLAVRTEDHPLSYADFAGDIPEGQYGAGHVEIWDHGNYENLSGRPLSEALAAGKAEIDLHGTKLKGKFALVRMAGSGRHENWLLIKMKDQYARSAPPLGAPASLPASRRSSEEPAGKNARAPSARRREGASGRRPAGGAEMESPRSRRLRSAAAPAQPSGTATTLPFAITHPDKVMFPDKGYTKADVLKYYAAVAPLLLPHLRDRPMTLERLPEGVRPDAPHFWQKRTPPYYPMWIPRAEITGADDEQVNYPLVNDAESLLYLVNQGALCFHPWLSRMANLDRPDFVLFDLDPGESSFANLIKIAKQLHQELEAERVDNFVKTSGKTGLHVLVPWRQRGGYDEAREWALEVARRVAAEMPALATTERSKSARRGRAYIDVMQNAKGHHVVPPYVLRAVPAATVSTPLAWSELNARLTPERFDLKSALKRFEKQKGDPMGGLGTQ